MYICSLCVNMYQISMEIYTSPDDQYPNGKLVIWTHIPHITWDEFAKMFKLDKPSSDGDQHIVCAHHVGFEEIIVQIESGEVYKHQLNWPPEKDEWVCVASDRRISHLGIPRAVLFSGQIMEHSSMSSKWSLAVPDRDNIRQVLFGKHNRHQDIIPHHEIIALHNDGQLFAQCENSDQYTSIRNPYTPIVAIFGVGWSYEILVVFKVGEMYVYRVLDVRERIIQDESFPLEVEFVTFGANVKSAAKN